MWTLCVMAISQTLMAKIYHILSVLSLEEVLNIDPYPFLTLNVDYSSTQLHFSGKDMPSSSVLSRYSIPLWIIYTQTIATSPAVKHLPSKNTRVRMQKILKTGAKRCSWDIPQMPKPACQPNGWKYITALSLSFPSEATLFPSEFRLFTFDRVVTKSHYKPVLRLHWETIFCSYRSTSECYTGSCESRCRAGMTVGLFWSLSLQL